MLVRLQAQVRSWWHETRLPQHTSTSTPARFQTWHEYMDSRWSPILISHTPPSTHPAVNTSSSLELVTWNVDAGALIAKSAPIALGRLWRVVLPSWFGRDALCCDIFVHIPVATAVGTREKERSKRIKLVNVHLDSLATNNSLRPRGF
jgi:hypothetical protein